MTRLKSARDETAGGGMGYPRFFAMIATSTVVMYGLMYLNTYALDHVFFSQTRMWMALYMGAVMAMIMLAFMLGMYSSRQDQYRDLRGGRRRIRRCRSFWCAARRQ